MKITNEIKAKVYLPYWGTTFINGINGRSALSLIDINDISLGRISTKLILKPLSSITDEDAVEASKIIRLGEIPERDIIEIKRNKSTWAEELCRKGERPIPLFPFGLVLAMQYLQSKGYDLPQYLLGGKTLHECGLAIYE